MMALTSQWFTPILRNNAQIISNIALTYGKLKFIKHIKIHIESLPPPPPKKRH